MSKSAIDKKHKLAIRRVLAGHQGRIISYVFGILAAALLTAIVLAYVVPPTWLILSLVGTLGIFLGHLINKRALKNNQKTLEILSQYLHGIPPQLIQNVIKWPLMYGNPQPLELPDTLAVDMAKHDLIYPQRNLVKKKLFTLQKWLVALKIGAPEILEEYSNGRTAKL